MKIKVFLSVVTALLLSLSLLFVFTSCGEPGAQGPQGEKGDKGDTGATGAQGIGIEKVEFDEDGNLLITFTNGTTQTVEMPEKEEHVHNFGEWINFSGNGNIPCEERLFCRICASCGCAEWIKGTNEDHDFETVTTQPTCTAGGYDTNTCSVCGKVEIANRTDNVAHPFNDAYSYDGSYHWFDCTTCDAKDGYEEHREGTDGNCTVCGEAISASEGIVYMLSSDGSYAEVVDYTGTATKIKIAETYEGMPVKIIGASSFERKNIKSVIIPDGVTSIGNFAFRYCTSLTSVTIPGSVKSIGMHAFGNCTSLASVNIENGLEIIGYGAFLDCYRLENITIPDSVQSIGDVAFLYCSMLIQKENSVSYVDKWAVDYDNNLPSVNLRKGTVGIAGGAFAGAAKLRTITISNSVKYIGSGAFSACTSLTSIIMPNSITSIGSLAFKDCTSLTNVTIGDGVTSIGDSAFSNCTNLTSINYRGTQEQWESISKGSYWDLGPDSYTITYNCTGE